MPCRVLALGGREDVLMEKCPELGPLVQHVMGTAAEPELRLKAATGERGCRVPVGWVRGAVGCPGTLLGSVGWVRGVAGCLGTLLGSLLHL